MHLQTIDRARAGPDRAAVPPVYIFEATVLRDAVSLLRVDATHTPLYLPSSACFMAMQASGASARIALQYISVGLGVNLRRTHAPRVRLRRRCDHDGGGAQYPDNMGVWEPLVADEVGGDAYTMPFKVAAYFSLDDSTLRGPVLHIRLNMHPALSRVLPPETPEQVARETTVFELRQKRFELKTTKGAST